MSTRVNSHQGPGEKRKVNTEPKKEKDQKDRQRKKMCEIYIPSLMHFIDT